MRMFKNILSLRYKNDLFLCSVANENKTDEDIMKQGQNLASEIIKFIIEWCPVKLLT